MNIKNHIQNSSMISLIFFAHFVNCAKSESIFILIHGTWGLASKWYLPGGDFFESLLSSAQKIDAHVISFSWTGKNNFKSREKAAEQLVYLIQSYQPSINI